MQKWQRKNNKKQKKKKSRKTKKAENEIKGEEIIEKNISIAPLDKKSYKNSEKIINMAEGLLYDILLCDRVNCNKKKETSELSNTSTSASKGGLEFLMTDPGVREQVIPAMAMSDLKLDLGIDFGIGTSFTVKGIETEHNFILKGVYEEFWRDYFELARINGEEINEKKMKKMKQVVDESLDDESNFN
ncbi:unnamed protein product [Meloidogyne enterolobii]|uniref:Uncharacterized protein n=1 Tax=Meloidogyne enterolobii TaxID=390850 RepID=A0ACB0XKH9_MELEN